MMSSMRSRIEIKPNTLPPSTTDKWRIFLVLMSDMHTRISALDSTEITSRLQSAGDSSWAAADQRARGFLRGATSGRIAPGGEGLQHQEGSSHLIAATIPNCKVYGPAFAGELAVILDAGMREMMVEQKDVFYYITLMNENYAQPNLPADAHAGVVRGCYKYNSYASNVIDSNLFRRVINANMPLLLPQSTRIFHWAAYQAIR